MHSRLPWDQTLSQLNLLVSILPGVISINVLIMAHASSLLIDSAKTCFEQIYMIQLMSSWHCQARLVRTFVRFGARSETVSAPILMTALLWSKFWDWIEHWFWPPWRKKSGPQTGKHQGRTEWVSIKLQPKQMCSRHTVQSGLVLPITLCSSFMLARLLLKRCLAAEASTSSTSHINSYTAIMHQYTSANRTNSLDSPTSSTSVQVTFPSTFALYHETHAKNYLKHLPTTFQEFFSPTLLTVNWGMNVHELLVYVFTWLP